jgi:galactokinase
MSGSAPELFKLTYGTEPAHTAFAPGRIEFIGNHTDYNGGLVMGAAVTEGITVSVARRTDREIHLISNGAEAVRLNLDNLQPISGPTSWTNYPAGVTKVMQDLGVEMAVGYNIAVVTTLPAGAGMSSSAAFELATALALGALYHHKMDKISLARIGRKAENEFVGMPCGLLDQGVSAYGEVDSLVSIDCATETFGTTAMPEDTHFWIFNSNKKHALVDSAYADRFKECHDALAILQQSFPTAKTLSEINQAQLDESKDALGGLLYRRACHIVGENDRVRAVKAALTSGNLQVVGAALNASHESSRIYFENSIEQLDVLVALLEQQPNLYGARLTGGGFGGAVMAFTSSEFSQAQAEEVAAAYKEQCGLAATIIHTQAGQGARTLS